MSLEKWDIEKTIAMCMQEEERLKASHGGSLNYVKDNKKKNYNQSNNGYPSNTWKSSHAVSTSAKVSSSGQRYMSSL